VFIVACKKNDVIDHDEEQSNWTKIVIDTIPWVLSNHLNCRISDIYFNDNKTGFIIGSRDYRDFVEVLFKTEDGGETWMLNKIGGGDLGKAILFATQTNGFSVRHNPMTENTIIDETNDGGTNWFEYGIYDDHDVYVPSGSAFRIDALNLIIGNLKSKDGGETWQVYGQIFGPCYFRDINYGVFLARKYNGLIMKTNDFCETWDTIFNNDLFSFSCIQMIDSNTIIAGGNKIIRSTDKGLSWEETDLDQSVRDIKFIDEKIGFAACGESGDSDEYGVSYHYGSIFKTIDGGVTWNVNYSSEIMDFTSLFIIDDQTIIAAGNQQIKEKVLDRATYILKTTTQGD